MASRILEVHFTPPGVIGGVEHIIQQHADLLLARGFVVDVVAGRRGRTKQPIHVIPELDPARPLGGLVEAELARGEITKHFEQARISIRRQLEPLAAGADLVIAHNAFTLHFSLPLTSVLWELAAERRPGSVIAWCHDLSWTNPLYIPSMHGGYPWDLLRTPAPGARYVVVSEERKLELLGLWAGQGDAVAVVPNGIDPAAFLRLSPFTRRIVETYRLFDRDAVLLLPVRITRRKNIEAGIRTLAALRRQNVDAVFLVSGPIAPHHPGLSIAYLDRLKALRHELGVDEEVIFLADALNSRLPDHAVAELYQVADVLLFTSAQEGFGLPILEAGLTRTPVVLTDILIFREIGADDVNYFALDDDADTIAESIMRSLETGPSRLFRRVLRDFRWDAIVERQILPLLLEAKESPVREALS